MKKSINIKFLNAIVDEKQSLESKLLKTYIISELIWALTITILCLVARMPIVTTLSFLGIFVFVTLLFYFAYLFKIPNIGKNIYFVFVLLTIPALWYITGGQRTAASVLFICEFILFVMCLKGKKQKVFMIITLITIPAIQAISQNFPYPIFPMDERQYQVGSTIIGLPTSLLIASILLKQKFEYTKERDTAIETQHELEKSNALQKNFLANMSHEIRSPLGIVMGFNNLIAESNDLQQIHQYSTDISHAGDTVLTVINDILDYSKIESGRLEIIEVDYSFVNFMSDIKRDIALKCSEKGLKFITKIDGNIPQNLHGDNIRIKQCLINLLSNAVKYTESGSITLECYCEGLTDDNRFKLKFVVADTGKGIPDEAIPKLYNAFQRLDEGANRGIEGTGLGLAITKNLVDQMSGNISVESIVGKGTTFSIELTQGKGSLIQEEVIVETVNEYNFSGIKVLAVDDASLNLVLLQKLLEKKDVDITCVQSGQECLDIINQAKYDIILLDHMMPEMDGVEVFKKIRKMEGPNKATPAIMVTANAMSGASKDYFDYGFNGYISKPIIPDKLYKLINDLVVNNN